ncbi:MAG: zeta toxin family protein [Candidatus Obscuribacterales bacterium]|nr:zeta toxin family protein [Candidatus Obscuribacterales bacterium]
MTQNRSEVNNSHENGLLDPNATSFAQRWGINSLKDSLAHTLIQRPIDALAQTTDQFFGSTTLPSVQFIEQPKAEQFGTVNWIAQQAGTAVGALPYLLAIHSAARGSLAPRMLSSDTQQLLQAGSRLGPTATRQIAQLEVSSAGITGATYSGLLNPVDYQQTASTESFLNGKAINTAVGAGTFVTMTASMLGLKSAASHMKAGSVKNVFSSDITIGTLAGVPSGVFGTQAESLLHGNGLASMRDTTGSVIASSLVGAGFLSLRQPLRSAIEQRQRTEPASAYTPIDKVSSKEATQFMAPTREPAVKPGERVFSAEEQSVISKWKAEQDQLPQTNFRETNPKFLENIANEVYGSGAPRRERVLHCLLGNCGSGKSSITDKIIKETGAMNPDSDVIKAKIPGYQQGLGNQAVHLDSRAIYAKVQERAFANGDNLIIQVTGIVKPDLAGILSNARSHGYSVVMHMVDVAPEISARRVFTRAQEIHPETGIRQMIPPTIPLRDIYQYNSRQNFFRVIGESARNLQQGAQPLVDGFRLWHAAPRESGVLPSTALASAKNPDDNKQFVPHGLLAKISSNR